MVKHTARLAVDLTIKEGLLEAFAGVARTMIAGSQKEAGTLRVRLVSQRGPQEVPAPRPTSMRMQPLAHFNGPVVQEQVPKLLETASVSRYEGLWRSRP